MSFTDKEAFYIPLVVAGISEEMIGIIMMLLTMMSTYRNHVTWLIPKMASIRRWMSNPASDALADSVFDKENK